MLQHTHAGCMAFEVLHSPYVTTTGTDSELFPPCRRYPVALMTANVAQLMWGVQVPVARLVEQPWRCAAR